MKNTKLQSYSQWLAVWLSCFTMVFSPVAMGEEAEQISLSQLVAEQHFKDAIKELNWNRNLTYGELLEKIKPNLSEVNHFELISILENNKNRLLPKLRVGTVKSTNGDLVPNMKFSVDGRSYTVQFFGEKNKFATVNGKIVSETDLYHPNKTAAILESNDSKFRESSIKHRINLGQQERNDDEFKFSSDYEKSLSRFEGFPRMNPILWDSLNQEKRAQFIVNMRMFWETAREVLDATDSANSTSKSINNKYFNYVKWLLNSIYDVKASQQCVVAGYIGTEGTGENDRGGQRKVCKVGNAIDAPRYQSGPLKFVASATAACRSRNGNNPNIVACNPIVYGFPSSSDGDGCVDKNTGIFQHATAWNAGSRSTGGKTCDEMARLSVTPAVATFRPATNFGSVEDEKTRIRNIEGQQAESYQLTRAYLDGILKNVHGATSVDSFISGSWTKEKDAVLVDIQTNFQNEIREAIRICVGSQGANHVDSHQREACQQLQRRWIFIDRWIQDYRKKSCPSGSTYDGDYGGGKSSDSANGAKLSLNLKKITEDSEVCTCTADKKKVSFKGSCGSEGGGISRGLLIAGVGIAALAGLCLAKVLPLCKQKKKKDPPKPPEKCPPGFTGTPPDCKPPPVCPPDSTGTPPNCLCIPPKTGTPGSCELPKCTPPKTGTPPACNCPTACSGSQVQDPMTCACSCSNPVRVMPGCTCPTTPCSSNYESRDPNDCLCKLRSEGGSGGTGDCGTGGCGPAPLKINIPTLKTQPSSQNTK